MTPLAGPGPLIDVHVHFQHEAGGHADWRESNARRMAYAERIGITHQVASILGSWGRTSPTYFPSVTDVTEGNNAMYRIADESGGKVLAYTTVNPNFTTHALEEIDRAAERGIRGIKLAASRRASDPLLDPVCEQASRHDVPVLQHIWQHRRHDVSNQEISDALDLMELAQRHPSVSFILAHIGGGGDWAHSLRALGDVHNIYVDLSGSGVDRGMLELCLDMVGAARMLWGTDLTMDTGLAKLRALSCMGLREEDLAAIRWGNAARIFHID